MATLIDLSGHPVARTDPDLEVKIRNVVRLYLDPPGNAVVISVYEKTDPGTGSNRAVAAAAAGPGRPPHPASNCTSCSTTTAPTSTPPSEPGRLATLDIAKPLHPISTRDEAPTNLRKTVRMSIPVTCEGLTRRP